jgi:hypothetical protein
MEELRHSTDLHGTFSGRARVTAEPPSSERQEIYDFLFFKLYLLSRLSPDLDRVLWQPVVLKSRPVRAPKSSSVRHDRTHVERESIKQVCFFTCKSFISGAAGAA